MSLGIKVDRSKPRLPCPCGCGRRGLCDSHRRRLAPIKAELAERHVEYSYGKGWAPRCCSPGCLERRESPAMFCSACLEAAE